MIRGTDALSRIVASGGFRYEFVADVIVDGQRVLEDAPLSSCELRSDGNAKVRTQGTATLTYSDSMGRSIIPEDMTSWMTPYATFLNVSVRVSAGGYSEKVLRGNLKVVDVSDPVDHRTPFQGRLLSVGSRLTLGLADRFAVTDRERFSAPFGPSDLTSTWAEIGRLTGLPLTRTVPDAPIRRAVTYKENRLDAVFDLASILGGIPYVTADGKVAIQPDAWPAPSEPLTMGPDGTVVDTTPANLSDEGIYNAVVVRSHDASDIILATATLAEGPLRYGGPFGRVPYFVSSEFVTTEWDAIDYARTELAKVSQVPAMTYAITCVPDPRREVGDVVPFAYNGRDLLGRIQEVVLPSSGAMTVKVTVPPGGGF